MPLDFSFFSIIRKKKERKEYETLPFENQNIELKQEYVPVIRKEVRFANAGGTIYVGVRQDGGVLGIDDPDVMFHWMSRSVSSFSMRRRTVALQEKRLRI